MGLKKLSLKILLLSLVVGVATDGYANSACEYYSLHQADIEAQLAELGKNNDVEGMMALMRSEMGNASRVATEQLAQAQSKISGLRNSNVGLRDQLRVARTEVESLEAQQYLHERTPEALGPRWIKKWLPANLSKLAPKRITAIEIDIDHFGWINATFGHDQADVVLDRLIAGVNKIVGKSTREGEAFFVRYGGEEFFLILIDTPSERSYQLAEAVRSSFDGDKAIFRGLKRKKKKDIEKGKDYEPDYMTLSLGVATVHLTELITEQAVAKKQIDRVMNYADAALYHSKTTGRNLVTTHLDLLRIAKDAVPKKIKVKIKKEK